jgi:hypothetical protein
VSPAQARRIRIFPIPGFGGGESIDLVYDLPNEAPFLREGETFDVGYLNSRKGNAYVLYHGDRYIKLGDQEFAMLTGVLGFNPTAKHRAQRESSNTEAGPAKERAAGRNVLQRRQGESTEDFAARVQAFVAANQASSRQSAGSRSTNGGTPISGMLISIVVFVAILLFLAWKGVRSVFRFVASLLGGSSDQDESMAATYAALNARVAERLSGMQPDFLQQRYGGQKAEYLSPAPSASVNSPARAFGRWNA